MLLVEMCFLMEVMFHSQDLSLVISCTDLEAGAYYALVGRRNLTTVTVFKLYGHFHLCSIGKKRNLMVNSELNPVDQDWWCFVLMQVWIHSLSSGIQTGLSTKSPSG